MASVASPYDPQGLRPPAVGFELPKNIFRFGEAPLWSSHYFAGGSAIANSNFRLFTAGRGMVAQGYATALTIAETNLKEGGRIPAGVAFSCYGISAHVMFNSADDDGATMNQSTDSDATVGNLLNLQNNICLAWDFLQTEIDIAPLSLVGAGSGVGGGIAGAGNGAANDFVGSLQNGLGGIWMYRKYPTELPAMTTFAIVLKGGSRAPVITNAAGGAGGLAVRVTLLGYYKNIIEIG